jgi:hypothetical protein
VSQSPEFNVPKATGALSGGRLICTRALGMTHMNNEIINNECQNNEHSVVMRRRALTQTFRDEDINHYINSSSITPVDQKRWNRNAFEGAA